MQPFESGDLVSFEEAHKESNRHAVDVATRTGGGRVDVPFKQLSMANENAILPCASIHTTTASFQALIVAAMVAIAKLWSPPSVNVR